MIVVNARIEATPETVAALKDAILAMQSATLEEQGCEDYTFSVELANPGAIRITERWTTQAALQAHFATPHMAAFQAAMQAHPP
ncbi:MAG: putative quinol monooxygenase, partial [Gammaproteobacteria bacterium]|nr:putative quinol monooxygenase [Gammaproteobacteria bacterium]